MSMNISDNGPILNRKKQRLLELCRRRALKYLDMSPLTYSKQEGKNNGLSKRNIKRLITSTHYSAWELIPQPTTTKIFELLFVRTE